MFLSCDTLWGGKHFGTGVQTSNLYSFGYSPNFTLVFTISVNGSASYAANCFIRKAGKSPGTVALLVSIRLSTNQT